MIDGDVNENDKRSRGLSQDDDEEDDEDEDIPGDCNVQYYHVLMRTLRGWKFLTLVRNVFTLQTVENI